MFDENLRDSFPSAPTPDDVNNFCEAARSGDAAGVTRYLDQYGASIINQRDKIDARAITWAAFSGNNDVIEILLSRGADINAGGTGEKPALGWAVDMRKPDTIHLLLEKGASLETRDNTGSTPVEAARHSGNNDMADLIEQWVEGRKKLAEQEEARRQEEAARALTTERLKKLKEAAPGASIKLNPHPRHKK